MNAVGSLLKARSNGKHANLLSHFSRDSNGCIATKAGNATGAMPRIQNNCLLVQDAPNRTEPKKSGMTTVTNPDIRIEKQGALNVVTLDRPKALNALTIQMRAAISSLLPNVARDPMSYAIAIRSNSEKAFSVGGDVREFVELAKHDMEAARRGFKDEYYLNWQHECFSKPTLSLINGLVMGSGVGVTAYGTHCIAGEGYRFAMPETAIGLFPDVGVAYLLARMPDHIGLYLGLTGRRISRAAAYALGLVTHCIAASEFDAIIAEVADVQPVDPVLDDRHRHPGPSELVPVIDVIRHCFAANSVPAILSRLEAVSGEHEAWAGKVIEELKTKSPLALAVTFKHICNAADMDLRETLMVDYNLVSRFLLSHDFPEGVRAAIIDKDQKPNWKPPMQSDVTGEMVNEMFQPVPGDEFSLPTRDEMQASRS